MRRLLDQPPKGIRYELIGTLVRATLNPSNEYEPHAFEPYQPYYCPVCGEIADGTEGDPAGVLALEFEGGIKDDFVVWMHESCFSKCVPTDEPDVEI